MRRRTASNTITHVDLPHRAFCSRASSLRDILQINVLADKLVLIFSTLLNQYLYTYEIYRRKPAGRFSVFHLKIYFPHKLPACCRRTLTHIQSGTIPKLPQTRDENFKYYLKLFFIFKNNVIFCLF